MVRRVMHTISQPRQTTEAAHAKAIEFAIKDAGVKPEEIDYINAHGTSTHMNDAFETKSNQTGAWRRGWLTSVKLSSTKSMVGHLLGAAGGVESIASIKSIMDNYVHVNAGLVQIRIRNVILDCVQRPWQLKRKLMYGTQ